MAVYVVGFEDDLSGVHSQVGGKGANLGLLTKAGFPVPPGFTVTTEAYRKFLATGGLKERVAEVVGGLVYDDPAALERVTAQVRDLITSATVPDSISGPITAAYRELGENTYVAVRSSGTAEDLAEASFAGMHDTYLDIMGTHDLLDAVKRCWASLWTARAASYRNTKGFDSSVGIAVVVQTMVPSEAAGVMFTANPTNMATDEIVVNASWGLGEAIVAGITTPDEFVLDHRDLHVKRRTLGDKAKQVVRNPETGVGTVHEQVPADRRERFCLSDEQLRELGLLGRRVQHHYGDFPQDTEWGFADGRCYLLQSRPVTGAEFSWDCDVDGWQWMKTPPDDTVWTRAWSDEVWTGAITPLFYSIRAKGFTWTNEYFHQVLGNPDVAEMQLWKYYRGNAYFNCSVEREYVARTTWPSHRPGMLANIPPAWHDDVLSRPFSVLQYAKLQARCAFLDKKQGVTTWWPMIEDYITNRTAEAEGIPDEQLPHLSDDELMRYLLNQVRWEGQYIVDVWSGFFIHGRDALGLLAQMVARWYDGDNETAFIDLITGLPEPTAAAVEAYELWRLAQDIKASPTLARTFQDHPDGTYLEAFGDTEEGRGWLKKYDAYLVEHGHRGMADRDMYFTRRGEDPAVDYRALTSFMASDSDEDPKVKEAEVEARRQAVVSDVTANLRKKSFGSLRESVFRLTMDYVIRFLMMRDNQRHWVDRSMYAIKKGFKEVSHRLIERGLLEGERDFYFLTMEELFEVMAGTANMPLVRAKIAARARNFDTVNNDDSDNPLYLQHSQNADAEWDRVPGQRDESGVLRGAGTSRGTVEGVASVVKHLEDIGRVRDGEILVVNATDPGWTPVFMVISGIVVETGGMLAHASCLAREYGMPAVHLPKAMKLIPDGARIRIDGGSGKVMILDADTGEDELAPANQRAPY